MCGCTMIPNMQHANRTAMTDGLLRRSLLLPTAFTAETVSFKAPATTGVFYFFNYPQAAQSDTQYLAPSTASTASFELLFLPE